MHEMSVVTSLLDIVKEELAKHNVEKLLLVRVKYGVLANIVPDAMDFAFEVLTTGNAFAGARLELVQIPVRLACGACGKEFTPEGRELLFAPCPACGEEIGHSVLTGRELYIDHIEAE
ncbi:MAG: hydrogenase maturation nickel metallochaperone HypA [Pseudomonadota bacterium]